jgi:hypothetical protein
MKKSPAMIIVWGWIAVMLLTVFKGASWGEGLHDLAVQEKRTYASQPQAEPVQIKETGFIQVRPVQVPTFSPSPTQTEESVSSGVKTLKFGYGKNTVELKEGETVKAVLPSRRSLIDITLKTGTLEIVTLGRGHSSITMNPKTVLRKKGDGRKDGQYDVLIDEGIWRRCTEILFRNTTSAPASIEMEIY